MIVGVGVDIVHIPRIQRLLNRYSTRFLNRIYRESELAEFHDREAKRNKSIEFLASRWAVKEAVYKAVYPHAVLWWKDTALDVSDQGKPRLVVDGRLERAFAEHGIVSAHVSLSHDGEYAVAHVILER